MIRQSVAGDLYKLAIDIVKWSEEEDRDQMESLVERARELISRVQE